MPRGAVRCDRACRCHCHCRHRAHRAPRQQRAVSAFTAPPPLPHARSATSERLTRPGQIKPNYHFRLSAEEILISEFTASSSTQRLQAERRSARASFARTRLKVIGSRQNNGPLPVTSDWLSLLGALQRALRLLRKHGAEHHGDCGCGWHGRRGAKARRFAFLASVIARSFSRRASK